MDNAIIVETQTILKELITKYQTAEQIENDDMQVRIVRQRDKTDTYQEIECKS